jgi:hypothetical protein
MPKNKSRSGGAACKEFGDTCIVSLRYPRVNHAWHCFIAALLRAFSRSERIANIIVRVHVMALKVMAR